MKRKARKKTGKGGDRGLPSRRHWYFYLIVFRKERMGGVYKRYNLQDATGAGLQKVVHGRDICHV